jgi:hypothetical protein
MLEVIQSLGAKEKIDFDQCLYVLEYFYTLSRSNNNQELTESQFKIVTRFKRESRFTREFLTFTKL